MDRRNVLILLIIILEVPALTFQVAGLGKSSAVLEVTEIKNLEGVERVEFTDEAYVPTLTALLVNETPFDVINWNARNSEAREYGYWDILSRQIDISLLNLTHLTFELQFRVRNGTQVVEVELGGLTNSTSADVNQTRTLILHVEVEDLPDPYPGMFRGYFSLNPLYNHVRLTTGGLFFRDVEALSFRVWATSTIPLAPVGFELNRSNNESLQVHQFAVGESRQIYVDIHPTNVTSLPDASGLHGEFWPWRSVDRIFLPPGTYSFVGAWPFSLTLMANRSTTCHYYVPIDKLSFVQNVEVPGMFVWVDVANDLPVNGQLVDCPSIYVWSASYLTVLTGYEGPFLTTYFQGYLTAVIEDPGSTDITISVQLPFITLGQVSISVSLALFLVTVIGALVLIGLAFVYDWRHARPTRLAVRAGPALLFVLSFLVPWASGHNMWVYGSALHDVYWTFIPGALTIAQLADTGHLIIMPMEPVVLFSGLWLCLGLFMYSHVRNTDLGWLVRLYILGVALPLALLLAVFLTFPHWSPISVYLTGPLLILTSILWHLLLAPKRNTAANPAVTVK